MPRFASRREFLRSLGLSAAALPFLMNLPSLGFANQGQRKQRLIVMFSPNGVVPGNFWPDAEGPLAAFKPSLEPLEPFRDRVLTLHGVCDKVRGDGDNHMRGIGCLLTGIELFPGNIQGGSHTPAGWSSGISIDQELKNHLQSRPETRTRFGSLELGVLVPERADTWTRMSYSGPNQPLAPIDDPYRLLDKLYGRRKDRQALRSVLDAVGDDLRKIEAAVSGEDRQLLAQQAEFIREMERELNSPENAETANHAAPELEPGVKEDNDNMPRLSRMQIDLLVHSLAADFARVATFQFTNSVGQAKMRWLGIEEGHHELSHNPDNDEKSQDKLTRINRWYCEQLAYLTKRLAETPEPGGVGSLLDNTLIVYLSDSAEEHHGRGMQWPMVLVGNLGGRLKTDGRFLQYPGYKKAGHRTMSNFFLSLLHAVGDKREKFGEPDRELRDIDTAGPLAEILA